MIHLKPHFTTFCLIFLFWNIGFATAIQAQEVLTSSGGEATGSGGTLSYTLGQLFYTTHSGTNGTIAEGVQQAYEISEITGIEQAEGIKLECKVYPNPTSDFLILKIEDDLVEKYGRASLHASSRQYIAVLIDMKGNLLESKKIIANETTISMANLPPSIYFLKIVQTRHALSQQKIKIFKIIKN